MAHREKQPQRTVLTVGGNALVRPGEEGSIQEQWQRALKLALFISEMPADEQLVLTHGNGPQVGRILLRSDLCSAEVPEVPIDVAVAATQGQMGMMLQQAIESIANRPTVTILTQVLVETSDPEFKEPNKFIGRFYTQEEAELKSANFGWVVKDDPGRGWRRVVASPQPHQILEKDAIHTLLRQGFTVIACGGGGVPVIQHGEHLVGVEAVVDKDRSSALLAHLVNANRLICLTGVDEVMVDFGTPQARPIHRASLMEMQTHLEDGQFPEGSMGPKIRSALQFLRVGGDEVVITSPERLGDALNGGVGTHIYAKGSHQDL